ncbi:MAG: hypothetical protein FWE80_01165 [Oscillospiraceae bacterium]|nr:hypothetical protein [Oscillospiraceae bacterium]
MFFKILEELFSVDPSPKFGAQSTATENLFYVMMITAVLTFILGGIIAVVHYFTRRDEAVSLNFMMTIAILPVVCNILVLLVADKILRVFTFSGLFALVRFRSVQMDPGDLVPVLFSLAIGMAAGLKMMLFATGITLLFVLYTVVVWAVKKLHGRNRARCRVRIQVPENLNWESSFDEVLKEYTSRADLVRVGTIELGSFYELIYDVTLNRDANEKAMIDELRTRNGNLTIQICRGDDMMYVPMNVRLR